MNERITLPRTRNIPFLVEKLILVCVEKDPVKRPHSAQEVLSSARHALASVSDVDTTTTLLPDAAPPAPSRVMAAPSMPRKSKRSFLGSWWVLLAASIIVIGLIFWTIPRFPLQIVGILIGIALIVIGLLLGRSVRRAIKKKRTPTLTIDLNRVSQSKALSEEVKRLIELCKGIDQRILGLTMAQMVNEVEEATASGDRQSALMNLAQLSQEISVKLSPWYVRREKLIAFIVTAVGIVSGIVSIVASILKMFGIPG